MTDITNVEADEEEIEVTEEMIEAGERIVAGFDYSSESHSNVAERVFRTMISAMLRLPKVYLPLLQL